jgi:hypothetical protein
LSTLESHSSRYSILRRQNRHDSSIGNARDGSDSFKNLQETTDVQQAFTPTPFLVRRAGLAAAFGATVAAHSSCNR